MVSPKISQILVTPCLWVMMVGMGSFLPTTMAASVCRDPVFAWGCCTATSSVCGADSAGRIVRACKLVTLSSGSGADDAGRIMSACESIALSGPEEILGAVSQLYSENDAGGRLLTVHRDLLLLSSRRNRNVDKEEEMIVLKLLLFALCLTMSRLQYRNNSLTHGPLMPMTHQTQVDSIPHTGVRLTVTARSSWARQRLVAAEKWTGTNTCNAAALRTMRRLQVHHFFRLLPKRITGNARRAIDT
jgi:hypothetical protein